MVDLKIVSVEDFKSWASTNYKYNKNTCKDSDVAHALMTAQNYVLDKIKRTSNCCCSYEPVDYSNDNVVTNAICIYAYDYYNIHFDDSFTTNAMGSHEVNCFEFLRNNGYLIVEY